MLGLMAENMKVNGKMESNMEKESTFSQMVLSKQEYGKMENVPNGQTKEKVELEQVSDKKIKYSYLIDEKKHTNYF